MAHNNGWNGRGGKFMRCLNCGYGLLMKERGWTDRDHTHRAWYYWSAEDADGERVMYCPQCNASLSALSVGPDDGEVQKLVQRFMYLRPEVRAVVRLAVDRLYEQETERRLAEMTELDPEIWGAVITF